MDWDRDWDFACSEKRAIQCSILISSSYVNKPPKLTHLSVGSNSPLSGGFWVWAWNSPLPCCWRLNASLVLLLTEHSEYSASIFQLGRVSSLSIRYAPDCWGSLSTGNELSCTFPMMHCLRANLASVVPASEFDINSCVLRNKCKYTLRREEGGVNWLALTDVRRFECMWTGHRRQAVVSLSRH